MSYSRNLFCLILAVTLAVVTVNSSTNYTVPIHRFANQTNSTNKSHNLILGQRQPGDRLIYQQNIVKVSKWMMIVEIVKKFNVTRFENITQVRAIDQKTNGEGAYVTRLSGGPGYNNITLKFKSQRSRGINFIVQIYAKRQY